MIQGAVANHVVDVYSLPLLPGEVIQFDEYLNRRVESYQRTDPRIMKGYDIQISREVTLPGVGRLIHSIHTTLMVQKSQTQTPEMYKTPCK